MKKEVIHYQKPKFQNSQQELLKESIFPFLLIGNVFTLLYSLVKPNISILPFIICFLIINTNKKIDVMSLVRALVGRLKYRLNLVLETSGSY